MRTGLLWVGFFWLMTAPPIWGQFAPVELPSPQPTQPGLGGPIASTLNASDARATPYRIWASSEFKLGWIKNAPLPIPLVTIGDPADAFPGAIGQPGTKILLGNSGIGFGLFSGGQFTLGCWIDSSETIGIEGSAFLFERRTDRFFAASDSAGTPLLALPFFSQTPGSIGERALRISDSRPELGQFAGNLLVVSAVQLWGGELNGILQLRRTRTFDAAFLIGFRYVDLLESLRIRNQTNDFSVDPNTVTFLEDRFGTRNQFYGGQLGARLHWQFGGLSIDVTSKLALGATHEVVEINGSSTQTGVFALTPGTFPGGIFAQPTNIGRTTKNQFTVLPSLELKVGYQLTQRLRGFVGYDVLYWNQVVRPGNQIDRNLNLSQSTVLGGAGGVLTGAASPAPLFTRTDFWAQGVNFGLELRY